jgi:hypothetical protein
MAHAILFVGILRSTAGAGVCLLFETAIGAGFYSPGISLHPHGGSFSFRLETIAVGRCRTIPPERTGGILDDRTASAWQPTV